MKKKFVIFTLLGCMLLNIPVMAATPTTTGGSGGAGGGGGETGGKEGTYIPEIKELQIKHFEDVHPEWVNTYPYISLHGPNTYWSNRGTYYQIGITGTNGTPRYYQQNGKWYENTDYTNYVNINGEAWYPTETEGNRPYLNILSDYVNESNKTVQVHLTGTGIGNAYITPSLNLGWDANGTSEMARGYLVTVQEENIKQSGGGKNYLNGTDTIVASRVKTPQTAQSGNGTFKLTMVNNNIANGVANTSYVNNIKMPDKVAPDQVQLSYLQGNNKATVNWNEPESNGTEYEFKVQVYRVDLNASGGLVLEQDSEFM